MPKDQKKMNPPTNENGNNNFQDFRRGDDDEDDNMFQDLFRFLAGAKDPFPPAAAAPDVDSYKLFANWPGISLKELLAQEPRWQEFEMDWGQAAPLPLRFVSHPGGRINYDLLLAQARRIQEMEDEDTPPSP